MRDSKLSRIIKKLALFVGISLLIVSIYLSYDGFDGSVNGNNTGYKDIGVVIGIVFALAVTVIQFIFANEYKQLNPTLIVVGILSYAYSIYTNKLGAQNILGMDGWMAWFTASMADIVAEPMISWGLGESLVGDLIGNLWKAVGDDDKNFTPSKTSSKKPISPQKYYPKPAQRQASRRPSSPHNTTLRSNNQSSPAYHSIGESDDRPDWMKNVG